MNEETPLQGITRRFIRIGKAVQPIGERTVKVLLISMFAVVMMLEINESTDGVISQVGDWFWNSILAYRSVNFGLGLLLCYLLMRERSVKKSHSIRERVFNTAPIIMDIDTLEKHAKDHGIELRLKDDPRISRQNPTPLPRVEPPQHSQPQPVQPQPVQSQSVKNKRDKRGAQ